MESVHRVVGLLATNVHILADEATREAIAIDTAIPSLDWVRGELQAREWTLKLIVSTHGHWDHMGDNARVAEHTGAALFAGSFGRVDLPGGSAEAMVASLDRLRRFDDGLVVLPGHGMTTSIGRERPWLEWIAREGRLPS